MAQYISLTVIAFALGQTHPPQDDEYHPESDIEDDISTFQEAESMMWWSELEKELRKLIEESTMSIEQVLASDQKDASGAALSDSNGNEESAGKVDKCVTINPFIRQKNWK